MMIIAGLHKKPSLPSPPNRKTKPFHAPWEWLPDRSLSTDGIACPTDSTRIQQEGRIPSLFSYSITNSGNVPTNGFVQKTLPDFREMRGQI
jgi:hypothetical protein